MSSCELPSDGRPLPASFQVQPPAGDGRVLLHSCCAPCAAPLMERIVDSGIKLEIYFYNPNIHPQKEYLLRKDENIRYAQKLGIPFVDADYDTQNWFNKTKGHENDPERGERCTLCFDMRFVKTAEYAREKGFGVFTSSLGISRWKDFDQITAAGKRAAAAHPGMVYWDLNWRKGGGSQRMIDLAKEETFYQQQYCGCVYSLRDTNRHRQAVGRPQVELGKDFYTPG
jgi:predicted adenine nucleotide alpha hydrolase (AANH) superfamily ATPase